MVKQRINTIPFDIRDGRAMVSLGPLSSKKYCTFSCPFCYVNADFLSYASMTISDIIEWLKKSEKKFGVIYVSGDTDSFAPPRTEKGLELLKALTEFKTDLLFTTRAILNEKHLNTLRQIQQELNNNEKLLIGCVSISQLSFPHLEPHPIPSPSDRFKQLRKFKELGLISVLAMRPFLPIIPATEYIEIINKSKDSVDLILGEVWYADKAGKLEKGVFQGPTPPDVEFNDHKMDFDINEATWKVFEAKETRERIENYCQSTHTPFFMRSGPALEWVRANKQIK